MCGHFLKLLSIMCYEFENSSLPLNAYTFDPERFLANRIETTIYMAILHARQVASSVTAAKVAAFSMKTAAQRGGGAMRVNGTRLMDSIHTTCEFGKAHPYGK